MTFFLGKNDKGSLLLESNALCTHAVCMGMTGSGKTGLGIALLEEAALAGIPAIIIDPKGDLGNLLLAFPDLRAEDFAPWVDKEDPFKVAEEWESGLKSWGEDKSRLKAYKDSVERTIYTPANTAGVPLSILNSFAAPSQELISDAGAFRERILSTTSSLLGLLGINADPLKSKEHILISNILENLWKNQKSLDLASLIHQIQNPPFKEVGVFPLDTFYPPKERLNLAMTLNNLLASTGFQAWMEGEPMDVQKLLYTNEGKPRHSILYIAHLSDPERMFFITLLLNEIVSWMRRQPGTSNLRAILYMDEIFGFFPSTSSPPSKMPMITLLKQARAFGLGIVLSTQNPIDLDYRGLGNCGTWFIGKLQTDRDRTRIIEGLQSSSNGNLNAEDLNRLLSSCKKRNFLIQSIHRTEPTLFETRWTMSYLSGPLTLPQISTLMQSKSPLIESSPQKISRSEKPLFPSGIKEFTTKDASDTSSFTPLILGMGKLHFVDAANKLDVWLDQVIEAPLTEDNQDVDWQQGTTLQDAMSSFTTVIPKDGHFENISSVLLTAGSYKAFSKSLLQYLYQTATLDLFKVDSLKLTSKANESEEEFRKRIASVLREKNAASVEKVKAQYLQKIESVQAKLQKAAATHTKALEKTTEKKWDALITVGKTILGGLFSKKPLSKTNIANVGSSLKKVGSATETSASQDEILTYQKQLDELQKNLQQDLDKVEADSDASQIALAKISIRPRKTDLIVESISIFWKPKV